MTTVSNSLTDLYGLLTEYFSLKELGDICFDLDVKNGEPPALPVRL